jgi:hypothetical protein
MEVLTALGGIGAAFGLSASAGLNAYIPLLVVALTARFTDLLTLPQPYNVLESWPVIGVLALLLLVETLVDKIPAVDTVNDVIQTLVRPTAGALLFAANANVVTDLSPYLAVVAGILLAGSVHATKGVFRPIVTASTAGTGNWAVSITEDVIAFFTSILAMFIPLLVGIVVLIALFWLARFWLRRRTRPQPGW